jgi:nucleotide-binding universal stress UspA family protein
LGEEDEKDEKNPSVTTEEDDHPAISQPRVAATTFPRRILCPTDFSPCSSAALAMAATIAEKTGATIDLLHVIELPVYARPEVVVQAEDEDNRDQPLGVLVEREVSLQLRAAVDALQAPARGRVTRYVFFADLVGGILAHAADHGCDLIAIGTHGRRGVSRAVLGSVTEHVLRRSPVPVLAVHSTPPNADASENKSS